METLNPAQSINQSTIKYLLTHSLYHKLLYFVVCGHCYALPTRHRTGNVLQIFWCIICCWWTESSDIADCLQMILLICIAVYTVSYDKVDVDAIVTQINSVLAVFTARCTLVQSAVLRSHVVCLSVCLSVTLVDCDHIGWNSSKLISPLVSLGCSLFAIPTWRVCSKGNSPKFGPKLTHPLLIWASETFDRKLRSNGYR